MISYNSADIIFGYTTSPKTKKPLWMNQNGFFIPKINDIT